VEVSEEDFQSIVITGMDGPRQPDGSLPVLGFMRLQPDSDLIDQGVDLGQPFVGEAPDLGAFENAGPEDVAGTGGAPSDGGAGGLGGDAGLGAGGQGGAEAAGGTGGSNEGVGGMSSVSSGGGGNESVGGTSSVSSGGSADEGVGGTSGGLSSGATDEGMGDSTGEPAVANPDPTPGVVEPGATAPPLSTAPGTEPAGCGCRVGAEAPTSGSRKLSLLGLLVLAGCWRRSSSVLRPRPRQN